MKSSDLIHRLTAAAPLCFILLLIANEWQPTEAGQPTRRRPYFVEYPADYDFTVDEAERCQQQKPFVVLIVPVHPRNRAHRDAIRQTWGSKIRYPELVLGRRVSLFFLLGLATGEGAERVHQGVLEESMEHGDLLQADFVDSYNNLTIKTMVMMEWLDSRCPAASYAMNIDSDMFLDVDVLVDMLEGAPRDNYMAGHVGHRNPVYRYTWSKWFLPHDAFAPSHYPPYVTGGGYVVSLDMPRRFVEASRHVPALYIEDVHLGLCMKHLGMTPTNFPSGRPRNIYVKVRS